MTVRYDRLGNRPRRVLLPEPHVSLPEDLLVALFFVLYEQERRRRAQRSG
jgi:hypothetical protein